MNKLVGVMAVEVVFWLVWLAEDCEVQGSNHKKCIRPFHLFGGSNTLRKIFEWSNRERCSKLVSDNKIPKSL